MKMKQLLNKLFLFGILGSFVLLYSCGGDDPEEPTINPPTIAFTASDNAVVDLAATPITVTADAGASVVWDFTVTAPGGFNTFRIAGLTTPLEFTRNDLQLDAGTSIANISVTTDLPNSAGTVSLTLTAVDEDGQSTEVMVDVVVESGPAEVRTAVLLAAPTGDQTSKTFYSVAQNLTYSNGDVTGTSDPLSAEIDLGYYYGTSANASLSSPSDYPSNIIDLAAAGWGTRNTTEMVKNPITASAYAELSSVASVETALAAVDFASAPATLTGLVANDIIAFKTAGGITGFIKVSEITGTSGSDGRINLEFTLAQEATTP